MSNLNSSNELIYDILHTASKVAAKNIVMKLVSENEGKCSCDQHDVEDLLVDEFMEDSLPIDDGRFGLAEPLSKAAAETKAYSDPLNPRDTAITLVRLIHHLMQRSKIQNRPKFVQNIREHLTELNPYMLSKKRNNPSAAIGAAMNIMKNVLQSQPPTVISSILGQLYRML